MIALAIASVLVVGNGPQVSDFFPLTTGLTWTYEDNGSGNTQTNVDTVGNEQEIGGVKAKPIVTKVDGRIDGSTFYRVSGDTVLVVAFDQNKPLSSPYPILKLGEGKTSWEYRGTTQWLGDQSPLSVSGTCKHTGLKELFGKKRETIEVVLDANIGPKTNAGITSHQVYVYASGVGLVEMKELQKIGKSKSERSRKLLSFSEGERD